MGILVGGDTAWKVRKHGDIVAAFHWVGMGQDAVEEPALVLFPSHPGDKAGCVIIGLSAAWKYADSDTGEPTTYLLQQLSGFSRQLGLILTSGTMRKIADVIVDSIPDLIDMPPEPMDMALERKLAIEGVGEADIKVDGQTIATLEI